MNEAGGTVAPRGEGPGESSSRAFVALVCALALTVRTTRLADSLWFDELWSTRLKLGDLWTFAVSSLGDLHPPGYALLMFAWIRLVGDSEWSIRLVPLAAGVTAVWATYRLGRLAFDERTGRLAAVLLAIAPVHVWYSQEARSYSLSVMLVAVAALAVAELRRSPTSRGWFLALAGTMVVLPFLHYYHLGVLLVLAWQTRQLPPRVRRALLAIAVMASFSVLAYAGVKQQLGLMPASASYLRAFTAVEAWRLLFSWFLTGGGLEWTPSVEIRTILTWLSGLVGAVLLIAGLARLLARRHADARMCAALFAVLPLILVSLTLAGLRNTYVERSALVSLPFFLILLAGGTGSVGAPWRSILAGSLVVLQVAGLAAMVRHADEWTVYKPREDWRSLAHWLGSGLPAGGDQAVLLANDPAISLAYYRDEFAERIDFATKLRDRGDRVASRLEAFGLPAGPLLGWVSRGADAAEARSRSARVLIVDAPLVGPTLEDLLTGRLTVPAVVVDVGDGPSSRAMVLLGTSPRFRTVDCHRVRRLAGCLYEPAASSPAGAH